MKKTSFNEGWIYGEEGQVKVPVRIPHDAMLHGKRDPECKGGSACGFFPGAVYEYEKTWRPQGGSDKEYILLFDGVYQKSKVYVNGKEAGGCVYGYAPFFVNVTPYINPEEDNVIRVVADNSQQPNSRWYSGGGIYRDVWLLESGRCHIAPQGVRVTTESIDPAVIRVDTPVEGMDEKQVQVEVVIKDGDTVLAETTGEEVTVQLSDITLWSTATPKLYTCFVSLVSETGELLDTWEGTFGIRQVTASKNGLFVNGSNTLLRGGCVHHDNGILGAASEPEAEWRRVAMLKDAGFNAIRVSHNPASPHMLAAADSLGMYVMDETWDMWFKHKNPKDYAGDFKENYKDDIAAMVLRDYNHPSVIMYSIGNEVSEPATEQGMEVARSIMEEIRRYDKTRLITGGMNLTIIYQSSKGKGVYDNEEGRDTSGEKKVGNMNSTMFNMVTSMVGPGMVKAANGKKADRVTTPICDLLDVAGYNYGTGRYPLEAKCHPNRVVVGSETFPQMIAKNWKYVEELPYVIGDFMWTSWDYLGEAGIGAWGYTDDAKGFEKPYPWLLADVGALDILGNPNGELYMANAAWHQLGAPKICVQPANHPGVIPAKGSWRGTNAIPTWSWKGCDGNKTIVEVYTEEPSVTLYINGKKAGKKKTKENVAKFKVAYESGTLRAVTESGKEAELVSAGNDLQISLRKEETRKDDKVIFVEVSITDAVGIVESNADEKLQVTAENARILGFGSAEPRTEESFVTGTHSTYYGKALLVVAKDNEDAAVITVKGSSLKEQTIQI